jgi:hypothetical protein
VFLKEQFKNMPRTPSKSFLLFALHAAVCTLAGCGGADAPSALTKSNEELQALAQQEDAAVYDLESKAAANAE